VALVGGGTYPQPGEIALSCTKGILFSISFSNVSTGLSIAEKIFQQAIQKEKEIITFIDLKMYKHTHKMTSYE